jgi:N-acetylglucosaminyldiphosphoundecaprenol N-acetyl-beta-D-mannosaminyltransferase
MAMDGDTQTLPPPDAAADGKRFLPTRRLIGHPLVCARERDALGSLLASARARRGGAVYFCNVHMCIEGLRDRALRRAMAAAEWLLPDGMPVVMALRLLGARGCERVAGMDAVPALCAAAAAEGLSVYFYGGARSTLDALVRRLERDLPELRIVGCVSPPFRPLTAEEEAEDLRAIERSGAHLCFVGLGCPKQERWIARNRAATGAILLGVGAAFATTAGVVSIAPRWVRDSGLEWLYRLGQEPRRLWRRYARTNPVFVNLFLRQLWSR